MEMVEIGPAVETAVVQMGIRALVEKEEGVRTVGLAEEGFLVERVVMVVKADLVVLAQKVAMVVTVDPVEQAA